MTNDAIDRFLTKRQENGESSTEHTEINIIILLEGLLAKRMGGMYRIRSSIERLFSRKCANVSSLSLQ